jgi:uridine kinase
VFLLRPELIDRWDLRIFVSATFEQALDRARIRNQALYGSTADVERRYRSRYIPSQQHYFATARPTDHADIIVHNDELQRPTWEVRPILISTQDLTIARPMKLLPQSQAALVIRTDFSDHQA